MPRPHLKNYNTAKNYLKRKIRRRQTVELTSETIFNSSNQILFKLWLFEEQQ